MIKHLFPAAALAALLWGGSALAADISSLLAGYQATGAGPFSAEQGAQLWRRSVPDSAGGPARQCADCHTEDLKAPGRHNKTGKSIDPLAPSATATRLTDPAKVEKWFERNCKGTWGRLCTPQEKGDLLTWINTQ